MKGWQSSFSPRLMNKLKGKKSRELIKPGIACASGGG